MATEKQIKAKEAKEEKEAKKKKNRPSEKEIKKLLKDLKKSFEEPLIPKMEPSYPSLIPKMESYKGGDTVDFLNKGGEVKKYKHGGSVKKNKMLTTKGWGASRKT
jgi:hypothetical protein